MDVYSKIFIHHCNIPLTHLFMDLFFFFFFERQIYLHNEPNNTTVKNGQHVVSIGHTHNSNINMGRGREKKEAGIRGGMAL